jgi:hypothetical protein
MVDVPDGDALPLDRWAIVSQARPQVVAVDECSGLWANQRSLAKTMCFQEALAVSQELVRDGEPVVIVRANAPSWEWLMLATEWPDGSSF